MNASTCSRTLLVLFGVCPILTAHGIERVRPGQWVGTTVAAGKVYPSSSCISQADASAMNGDAKSVKAYLEKIIPVESCTIADVKVDGSKIVYSAICGGQPARVITTLYHGSSSEGSDSSGTKTEAKLIGACK